MSESTKPEARGGFGPGMLGVVLGGVALAVALFALYQSPSAQVPPDGGPTDRTFALSSDLVEGSNRYHPATLVAFEGDNIVFSVTNRGAEAHGFTVEGLNIEAVVDQGDTAEFTAPGVETGVYRYFCQLHPGHISGQLIVFGR